MSLAMKFFQPDDRYINSLVGLARVGADRPDYLQQGVEQLMGKARKAPEIAQRNRYVIDALGLLAGTWRKDADPDVLDPHAIENAMAQVPKTASAAVLQAAEDFREGTWPTFQAFSESAEGQRRFDPDRIEDIQAFLAWFRLYRPYLVLGIPEDEEAAETEVRRRIDWMVAKIATSETDDPAGIRNLVLDTAWGFARKKYFEAQAVKNAEASEPSASPEK